MPALERLFGWRVVADPAALDAAHWSGDDVFVLRIAHDEAFGIGATGVELEDPDAVSVEESGFVGAQLDADEILGIADHVDWQLPEEPNSLAQGKVAGVPARIRIGLPARLPMDEQALLVTHAAYADELRSRLGW